jgi:hypothetical protein
MDLFADVTPVDVGGWLLCAAAVIGLAVGVLTGINQWRNIVSPPKPGDEFVTASQIGQLEESRKAELDRVESRLKSEIIRVDQDQTKRSTDLDLYCRTQFHDLRNQLNEMNSKIIVIPISVRTAIDLALQPLTIKVDRAAENIVRISTLLSPKSTEDVIG